MENNDAREYPDKGVGKRFYPDKDDSFDNPPFFSFLSSFLWS